LFDLRKERAKREEKKNGEEGGKRDIFSRKKKNPSSSTSIPDRVEKNGRDKEKGKEGVPNIPPLALRRGEGRKVMKSLFLNCLFKKELGGKKRDSLLISNSAEREKKRGKRRLSPDSQKH